jgi:hypothetical protein
MKKADRTGFLLGSALMGALTGCATYVAQPGGPTVYVPAPPQVIVEPPRVVVEPPRVIVAPPPVYVVPPPSAPAPMVEIRAEADFYEPLTPYGRWEVVGPHGRCWIPARVAPDWRPYCNGHWERTEAGWYWASDEPWAWATYHYGRWDLSPQLGWYWVPQIQWAPSWVSWHRGGGYVGWAPLLPGVSVAIGGPVELDLKLIPPRAFVFVEEKRFLEPVRPTTVIVHNTTIINKTVNITNIKVVNNTVINEGPRTEIIERASGRHVQAVPVHELRRKEESVAAVSKRVAPPVHVENVQTNIRNEGKPAETKAEIESEKRGRELHQKAQEESQRAAQELQRKAQLESEQRARGLQRKAQEESQKLAKDLERKAQLEAAQRTRELHQKAEQESQVHAKELERKAQLEAEQQAKNLQIKAQEESQRAAKELERKAQIQAEQRAWELHQKTHEQIQNNARAQEKKTQVDTQRRSRVPAPVKVQNRKTEDQPPDKPSP